MRVWRFIRLFPAADRFKGLALLGAMAVGGGLESLGIGLVMPFVALLLDPAGGVKQGYMARLYALAGQPPVTRFAVGFGLAVLAVSLIKNSYLGAIAYLQYRFLLRRQLDITSRLFRTYIGQPYPYFLQHNSALLLRNVSQEVDVAFAFTVVPAALFTTELVISAAILILLLALAPGAAIFLGVMFGGIGLLFHAIVRKRLTWASRTTQQARGQMMQWMNQAFGSIKETKVLQREDYFHRKFYEVGKQYVAAIRAYRIASDSPRMFVEALAVAAMVLVGCVVLLRGNAGAAVPTMGVFAIAAIRLTASANRIVFTGTSMKNGAASFDLVLRDLESISCEPSPADEPKPLPKVESLDVSNVSFSYDANERQALRDVSFRVAEGEKIAIVGPSGAGKTTMIDLLLGLLEPQSGAIRINGRRLDEVLPQWRASIGYIPQEIFLLDDTIRNNVAFGREAGEISDHTVWDALRIANLADFVAGLEHRLDTRIGEKGVRLSGGERQRIGIARALYDQRPVLILDEATSALDNTTERQIQEEMFRASEGKMFLVIAHRLTTVRRVDRILLFSSGRLAAQGSYDELLARSPEFQQLVRSGSLEMPPRTVEA